jgi:Acyl-CoA thioester hydrolase/BAAT N-terminal region
VPWRSHATFVADSNGRVDVTRQAPIVGTYDGVAPMGLFWSCIPVAYEQPAPPDTVMQPQIVRLDAEAPGAPAGDRDRWTLKLFLVESNLVGGHP